MSVDRIKFQNIVESQVPDYVRDDFPLLVDFLKQYYVSQEYESGTYDLVQNIDQYVKVEELTHLTTSTILGANLSYTDTTITTNSSGNFTEGFPTRDGLIQIDDEIIYYEYKTDTAFENCTRGFSAVTSYEGSNTPDELLFKSSEADTHTAEVEIKNLNIIFLQKFLTKLKTQVLPGFEDRTLYSGLNQENFIHHADSFYKSKGTDRSFEILFRALYGQDVEVIRPSEFLLRPSNANFKVTTDIIVEKYLGDPMDLKNKTLFQDSTGSRGSVSNVRPVVYNGKVYYQVSLDLGYDRDINVDGTVYSSFVPNKKTKILNDVSIGSTYIDVESTIGFPQTGIIDTTDIDGIEYATSFTSKNDNQFFNVPPVTNKIEEGTDITLYDLAYAYVSENISQEKIEVKISTALKDIVFEDKNHSLKRGDTINLKSIGIGKNTEKTRNWNLNIKANWKVKTLTLTDTSQKRYSVKLNQDHNILNSNNKVTFTDNKNNVTEAIVVSITSSDTFTVTTQNLLDLTEDYSVENQTLSVNSTKYSYLNKYFVNVQNIYSKNNNDLLVSSNSIPSFNNILINPYNRSLKFSGVTTNNAIKLLNTGDHGYYTGDTIYYTPGTITTTTTDTDGNTISITSPSTFEGVEEGVFYIKRVDNLNIKLAKSSSNLFNDIFVTLNGSVVDVTFDYFNFHNKIFEPQSIYREISSPVNKSGEYKTVTGYTGILNNGVEILNYKSPNKLNYGGITDFKVVNGGKGYDVINPPILRVDDIVGTGATGVVNVKGQLERIDIIDSGFDYQQRPIITISGGNGNNASAEVRLSSVTHDVTFNAEQNSAQVSLGSSTIGFSTFHKFRDSEEVIYLTDNQQAVGGLSTAASYYVGVVDSKTIKLYENFDDSIIGINTIRLSFFGNGVQKFRSSTLKDIVTSIVVTNPGTGYENKERGIVGVNTASNEFTINDHGYSEKEIVNYTGSTIDGLTQSKDYYVVKIDDNKFSLSEVGTGNTSTDYYYNRNVSVDLRSTGSGSFNYKPIVVSVDGITGVSTRAGQDFSCQVQPIFRGEIESIDVTGNGIGYGSSEVINFDRKPVTTVFSGSAAILIPVINNGQVVDVLINNPGTGYNSPPDLEIQTTTGKNAVLTPILNDGKIESVNIIKGGAGYVPNKTTIKVTASGNEVVIDPMIDQWNINLFERNFNNIDDDDGFLDININNDELQYSYLYAPRPLRENTFVISGTSDNNTRYGVPDLKTVNGIEVSNTFHSPIIGWAYDGNPIYGPYGFNQADGSSFVNVMKSGYELKTSFLNRPPISLYPLGFFIEDYIYTGAGDLDEHNGRFCVTPDYPNGTYAYFATINTINDSVGPFKNFRRPQFPYLIGDSYSSLPNITNFKTISNQNDYDIQSNGWLRNTYNYNLNDNGYKYIFNSNLVNKQKIEVTSASLGVVEEVDILAGGSNYKVNDEIIFDDSNSGGNGARSRVTSIEGNIINTVSVATTSLYDVEFTPFSNRSFIGFSTQIHSFNNDDIINVSGLSSYFSGFDRAYNVGVRTDNFVLTLGISTASTNDVDYLYVNGILEYPFIRPDDIFTIDEEKVRVLNLDQRTGRIRVQRAVEGTSPVPHQNSSILYENPKKFRINVGSLKTTRIFNVNEILYFDPAESVGLGTVLGTGIGNTITFSNPGVGQTQVFIEPQSIYYPHHNLKLNDSLIYTPNGGTSIEVWNGSSTGYVNLSSYQNLYAVPLSDNTLGISSNKVGLDSTGSYIGVNTSTALLYITNVGAGNTHKFTTNLNNVITAEAFKNVVTVSTSSTHGLTEGDLVSIDIKPNVEDTVIVKYNDFNRRIVFDPKTFTSGDVDIVRNSINFSGEFFKLGDKVIHTSSSPSSGLEDNAIYYIVPFNRTKVRLVREKYEVNLVSPNFIDITSASGGTLSKINPRVQTKKNNTLTFDLSDSSLSFISGGTEYPAFSMNLYSDREYSNIFFNTGETNQFEVVKTGRPGVDSDASLKLSVRDTVPTQLYYRFEPDHLDIIPSIKSDIIIDNDVNVHNSVEVVKSLYNGSYNIVGVGSTSFDYTIKDIPDVSLYNSSNSTLKYTTTSKSAFGAISNINVDDGGSGYKELPGITSIRSGIGSNAIVTLSSNSIGEILSTKFEEIGFDYPSDQTLKVVTNIPEVLEVEALQSIKNIIVTSSGKNYLVNPELVILDGFTNKIFSDVDLRYNLGDTEVEILKNTNGLYSTTPTIIPIRNSNGVGISSIDYTESTKNVRVYLGSQFSDSVDFRYKTGAKVLIEGISVAIGSTDIGYNSENYNYALFDVTGFDMQLGGSGAYFEYSLDGYLNPGESPGIVDEVRSAGRAIPESDFPVFDINLKPNNFFTDEIVTSGTNSGIVERWNPTNRTLVVSTSDEFEVNSKIIGEASGTEVIIQKKFDFNSKVATGAGTTIIDGWKTNIGFLNDSLQKTPNNEYYQNLSYSLKSTVPLEKWDDAVSSLGHVAGLAKFADLIVESTEQTPGGIIVSTPESDVEVVIDVISESSIHCWQDFDNVSENSFYINGLLISDEIIFENKILTDFNESFGNRVLSIDDFSSTFNSVERPDKFANVGQFPSNYTYNKILVYNRNQVLTNNRQVDFLSVLHNKTDAIISQYGTLDTKYLGSYDFVPASDGTEWFIRFYPINFAYHSYDLSSISFSLLDNISGVGTTTFGDIVQADSSRVDVPISTTTTVAGISTAYRSAKLLVQIEDTTNNYSVDELNLVHDGTDVYLLEYGDLATNAVGFGTFNAYIDSGSSTDYSEVTLSSLSPSSFNQTYVRQSTGFVLDTDTVSSGNALLHADSNYYYYVASTGPANDNRALIYSTSDSKWVTVFTFSIDFTEGNISDNQAIGSVFTDDVIATSQTQDSRNVPIASGDIVYATTSGGSGDINVDFIPNVGVALTVNTSIIATSDTGTGPGTIYLDNSKLESKLTSISASGSPGVTTIASYSGNIESSYYIVTVNDTTNSEYESFEVISLSSPTTPAEFVEYANVQSSGSLGQVGIETTSSWPDILNLTYTPNSGIDVEVRVFSVGMEPPTDNTRPTDIDLNNSHIHTDEGTYSGTKVDLKTAFGLTHNGDQIFLRAFDGSDPTIVDITKNSVTIPNHFFVTGEEVTYTSPGIGSTASIGIGTTAIPGIGVTDKLPTSLYVVAPNNKELKFSSSAENSLKYDPIVLDIESIGSGVGHSITSTKQAQKVLLAIDNIVQSPIVSFGITTTLAQDVVFEQDILLSGITSIFTGDNLRIGNEIVTVASVGVGNTTSVNVLRARMGTTRHSHSTGDLVEKLSGEYNIVNNTVNFASAPKGPEPIAVGASVDPDGTDWTGITSTSSFQGRSFMRSGIVGTTDETYTQNYIFDNSSYQFTGIRSEFSMKVDGVDVTGVATHNPFIVLNGIVQQPTGLQPSSLQVGDYRMTENTGVTSITFIGNGGSPTGYDPNNGEYPIGGLMVSVGSSNGFGYQPLVSAGGTVTVSSTGTISAVSIANSGSGYRSGIQTVVNVGVQTYSSGIPNIEFIGTAAISGGHIVSVAITNPGTGYTGTNLPDLLFDDPLSYENIPLSYAPGYVGSGQSATVDIVVGQGSSVINFILRNSGFGYGNGERLVFEAGGTTGIPTNTSLTFENFQLLIDEVYYDKFNSWSVGNIEVLDTLDNEFDGFKTNFQITLNESTYAIATRSGSLVDVEQTLVVFINDILQVPGIGYKFNGGSIIEFTEAPKVGDTSKILFYKGTGNVDVKFVDILETVKPGDTLNIDNNPELGQDTSFDEDLRVVTGINTADSLFTNPYSGPGVTTDPNFLRPVTWCKQLVDKVIDNVVVGKDRTHYEPLIYPSSYVIQSVSAAATFAYVDTVEPLYDAENESYQRNFQNSIIITSQDSLVSSSASAVVSTAGTITSINITNPGVGYTLPPQVTISTPVGVGTTQRASATANIINYGVNSATVINPGTGYTSSNPPTVLIETPNIVREGILVDSYVGDYGIVVAMGRSTVSGQDEMLVDFYIPENSFMRNTSVVGTAVTVSTLDVGDYFTMFNTNVSISTAGTLISERIDGSQIAITTSFADSVYQVRNAATVVSDVVGVGVTYVRRITSNLTGISSGTSFDSTFITFDSTIVTFDSRNFQIFTGGISTSNYIGNYSWGRINFDNRVGISTFNFYGNDGYSGISTSSLVVRRSPLKYDNYV